MADGELFGDGELGPHPTGIVQAGLDAWNEAAAIAGWPKVTVKSAQRLRRLKMAIQDAGGLAGWKTTLAACQASPFLMGRTTPPFLLTFDWLTKPANLVKVLEGNYTDRRGPEKKNWRQQQVDDARAAVDRILGGDK